MVSLEDKTLFRELLYQELQVPSKICLRLDTTYYSENMLSITYLLSF